VGWLAYLLLGEAENEHGEGDRVQIIKDSICQTWEWSNHPTALAGIILVMKEITAEVWHPARPTTVLQPGQVHVWRASLITTPDEVSLAWRVLSAAEQARADRFRFELHRGRFVRAHAIMRGILAFYTATVPAQLQFRVTATGKPYLAGAAEAPRFNLSHSEDLMVLAVCQGGDVGVDVEVHSAAMVWRDIAESYFTLTEIEAIENGASEPARLERFYRAWTLKEAYLKAQGAGLAGNLDQVEIDLSDETGARFSRLPGAEHEKHRWQAFCFQPASGASGALVTEYGLRRELVRFSVENLAEVSV